MSNDTKKTAAKNEINYANFAALEFPTDVYGMTRELRAAVQALSSRIDGSEDKKKLVNATVAIIVKHIKAKTEYEAENRAERVAKAKAVRNGAGERTSKGSAGK